jgi:hypothetical protein
MLNLFALAYSVRALFCHRRREGYEVTRMCTKEKRWQCQRLFTKSTTEE